jgi:predicted dehydrogenase
VNPAIKGEDVANVLIEMQSGLHCFAEMSYASLLEKEAFPQTLVLIEGTKGSLHLTNDFVLKTTTSSGTVSELIKPVLYSWLDPAYAVVHSSIVDCNRNILNGLRGEAAETTGEDNFETVKLVFAAYESARTGEVVHLKHFGR